MTRKPLISRLASLALLAATLTGFAAEKTPDIKAISRPVAGYTQIIFHGGTGPFQIQHRETLDPNAAWVDLPGALVTELEPGVFMGQFVNGQDDLAFYRISSVADGIIDLKGWSVLMRLSPPANGIYYARGESPVITVSILDNFAQGYTRADFASLNLYMYGPQDPKHTVTAVKMLNAVTDRSKRPHHYIDLKTNPDVKVDGNTLTYALKAVTDEYPGTYTLSLYAVLGSDNIQQVMRFTDVQVGTAQVEKSLIADDATGVSSCAPCHKGPISGRLYMHHIDPGFSPTGNWSLDYLPQKSCKSCHNNEGYAGIRDQNNEWLSDTLVRRVHGVHMGEGLKLPFNTNQVNGSFKDYTHVVFPSDARDCTKCHVDDRWTTPSQKACAACHDNTWFGLPADLPAGMELHSGGKAESDTTCVICHDSEGSAGTVAHSHTIPPPAMDVIDVSLTPPVNGSFYVAGEKPILTLVIRDDAGNPIDHTKVTDVNFSTASLFVYGPRSRAVPVLTSTAKNVNSKLRASVSNNQDGPWAGINGKVFRISINGSAPQDITIVGAGDKVTAAEVVASLNPVITTLNGGAKATVSGARVNIKTLIQGAKARIEIYDGDVTAAMVWKRTPNTILEPDVTIAAGSTPGNDLRALSDPLDFADPAVTRNPGNIQYQLDDVAALTPGTYNVYVYHLPKAGKIPNLARPTGIGHLTFQVGTATPEKLVAANCKDCHGETIFHLASGPIHAEPFETDYCNACHDYGHNAPGELFKNQGGTSLNGWSGFGAMPIVRRVHGVHFAHYLEHSEEIYANATKSTFGEIIFPQDVRNCTKCHAQSDSWKQKPSRIACLACHDSDADKAHGQLMTWMPDPSDPYGPKSVETCVICHGQDAEFSADKVHDISSPYAPPYPRDPGLR